jgi:hypothetical protein
LALWLEVRPAVQRACGSFERDANVIGLCERLRQRWLGHAIVRGRAGSYGESDNASDKGSSGDPEERFEHFVLLRILSSCASHSVRTDNA